MTTKPLGATRHQSRVSPRHNLVLEGEQWTESNEGTGDERALDGVQVAVEPALQVWSLRRWWLRGVGQQTSFLENSA